MNMEFSTLGDEISKTSTPLGLGEWAPPRPSRVPQPPSSWWHVANVVISSSMFVVVFVTFVLICILCGELSRTLTDVNEMMPEVARVLSIVIQLCDIPEVAPYCGDGSTG